MMRARSRHHRELLVRIGQQLKEVDEIIEASDTVELAAHDDGWDFNLGRVDHRQVSTHVDIGAVGDRAVECDDRVGERVDDSDVSRPWMVTREDGVDKGTVDRATVL